VWGAADKVAAVFGFNPATRKWDRVIHLPWFPYYSTTLATPRPGVLTINGQRTRDDKVYYAMFASIDSTTGRVRTFPQSVVNYVVINEHEVIVMDPSANLSNVNLDTGIATLLAKDAPVCCMTGRPRFATAGDGRVWFGMVGTPVEGLGVLDPATGAMDFFSFPHPNFSPPPSSAPCPSGAFHCVPPGTVRGMEMEAVIVDKRQDVWVVNEFPGLHNPNNAAWIAPIVELLATGGEPSMTRVPALAGLNRL